MGANQIEGVGRRFLPRQGGTKAADRRSMLATRHREVGPGQDGLEQVGVLGEQGLVGGIGLGCVAAPGLDFYLQGHGRRVAGPTLQRFLHVVCGPIRIACR